jgi:DnaK suppressor protein
MSEESTVQTTNGLTAEQIGRLRTRLDDEREATQQRLAERRTALARAAAREPDEGDWATSSADQSLLARLADRDTKLLHEIDRAQRKLEAGNYGLCELTDEPIGFDRLWARPWARQSVALKERREQTERHARASGALAAMDAERAGEEEDPGREVA